MSEISERLNHIKGLLFDKDGTLIDFNRSWLPPMKAAARLVAEHAGEPALASELLIDGGYIPALDSWQQDSIIAYETSEAMLESWGRMTSKTLIETLTPQIQSIVHEALYHAVPVVNDIKPLLSGLATNYVLGVASMDDEINVKRTLSGLDLHDDIQFYCGSDSGFGHKPGGGMVEAFCTHTGFNPEQIAVIGDSTHDLRMAKAAGAVAIGVLSGASSEQTLSADADYLFADIGVLSTHLPKAIA